MHHSMYIHKLNRHLYIDLLALVCLQPFRKLIANFPLQSFLSLHQTILLQHQPRVELRKPLGAILYILIVN